MAETPPLSILLADDNAADLDLMAMLLGEAAPSAIIHRVSDGEQALDFLTRRGRFAQAEQVSAVILDLNLPRRDGIEVLTEMRRHAGIKHTPVFLLTSSGSPEDRVRVEALGVSAFLTKPAELDDLERLMNRLATVDIPHAVGSVGARVPVANPMGEHLSSDAFRLMVHSVRDYAIFMLDTQGHILTWNEGAQKIKQYNADEVIGRHFSVFYTPEDIRTEHPQYELLAAEKDERYQEEGWRVRKDGTRFWASVTISAIRDPSGKLLGFGKVTRDMTERKAAIEALRESEGRFRILVDVIQDYAIFMLDPEGRIASWNKGAERAKGYTASEVLGRHFSIFYTEEARTRKHADFELEQTTRTGTYEEEGIRVRKDGTTFWANVVITAIRNDAGELKGFAKITRDITERKRTESEAQKRNEELERRVAERTGELEQSKRMLELQREELLRSNTDLKQFAFIASHDLQEPVRMVTTYLQLLRRSLGDKLDASQRKHVDLVLDSATRMRRLVSDLLSYARVERSGDSTEAMISLEDVVTTLRSNLASLLAETRTTLTAEPLPPVKASATQVMQLLQNLVTNAITYRSPDRAPEIHIGTKQDESGVRVYYVRDNGLGIEEEYFQKIFVLFQRLHGDRSQYPGTGIGLAVCKKIVERYRGRIWLESQPGVGSTFYFTLG